MDAVFEHPGVARNALDVALHESAHAVTADRLGLPVIKVELRGKDGGFDGYTFVRDHDRARVADWLPVLLAGKAAEREILGYEIVSRSHDGSDEIQIADALARVRRDQQVVLPIKRSSRPLSDGPRRRSAAMG